MGVVVGGEPEVNSQSRRGLSLMHKAMHNFKRQRHAQCNKDFTLDQFY